jgi:hypothetical protein
MVYRVFFLSLFAAVAWAAPTCLESWAAAGYDAPAPEKYLYSAGDPVDLQALIPPPYRAFERYISGQKNIAIDHRFVKSGQFNILVPEDFRSSQLELQLVESYKQEPIASLTLRASHGDPLFHQGEREKFLRFLAARGVKSTQIIENEYWHGRFLQERKKGEALFVKVPRESFPAFAKALEDLGIGPSSSDAEIRAALGRLP